MTRFIGASLDALPLKDRAALGGKWVALEIYTPETLPLRIIEAIGATARECVKQLRERGLDQTRYEFTLLPPPY